MAPLSLAWSTTFPFSRETACFSLGTLGTSAAGWVHAGVHGGGRGASFEYPAYKFGRLLFWELWAPRGHRAESGTPVLRARKHQQGQLALPPSPT